MLNFTHWPKTRKIQQGTFRVMAPMPTKLQIEPLVDALFEIQFVSSAPAAQVLPGFLFSKLEGEIEVKSLSPAFPPEVIAVNPAFKYQPTTSLIWNRFHLRFSEQSIQVVSPMPYPGWSDFLEVIDKVFDLLVESGIVKKFTRYSLKCVDFIQAESHDERLKTIAMELIVGREHLHPSHFQVHVEIPSNIASNLITVACPARAQNVETSVESSGILITTDSIVNGDKLPEQQTIQHNFRELVDTLHKENKFMFFNSLSEKGIQSLGPSYD